MSTRVERVIKAKESVTSPVAQQRTTEELSLVCPSSIGLVKVTLRSCFQPLASLQVLFTRSEPRVFKYS